MNTHDQHFVRPGLAALCVASLATREAWVDVAGQKLVRYDRIAGSR